MGECIHIRRDVNALTFLPFLWEETMLEGYELGCVNDDSCFDAGTTLGYLYSLPRELP